MANKGNRRHIIRLASSKYMKLERKVAPYVAKPLPGRHTGATSISIGTVLREKLKEVGTLREAEIILESGAVKVNGKVVKESKFPVGFGDSIELLPSKEHYKVTVAPGGAFALAKHDKQHLFKVVRKYIAQGNKIMIQLHDGTILPGTKEIRVNDSVEIKAGKVERTIHLDSGQKCFVINGQHASETGTIKQINPGSAQKDPLVKIEGSKGEFETLLDNIMVV